jgi:hypothetical protein
MLVRGPMLPVDIVLAPSWWFRNEGITFDEDFFYNPTRRVEVERQMEKSLYERWGKFGLGENRNKDLPIIGPVHLAAGYLISEMLGCKVEYCQDSPPLVVPAERENLHVDPDSAFRSQAFGRFMQLVDSLKLRFGSLLGDVNWSGVLNLALDLRGQRLFTDIFDRPSHVLHLINSIGTVIEKFVGGVERETGTSSVSVNRTVRFFDKPIFLHSECSHTMISTSDYEKLFMPIDRYWSQRFRPFGIHYCGKDPHRYADVFSQLPHLDFLDVGCGGDIQKLRKSLPDTFLNIRLSPVEIIRQSTGDIQEVITGLVRDSADPYLTGICCINMDDGVGDEKIMAIFETVHELRLHYMSGKSRVIEVRGTKSRTETQETTRTKEAANDK